MQTITYIGILLLSYLLGSLPNGVIIVKLLTGRDIRKIESGRTGGTNAMRAAGFGAGLLTGVLDFLKSALAAWIAMTFYPGKDWLHILAPLAAVIGHNYSIFLAERSENGRLKLRGGAGGGPTAGGAFALSAPSISMARSTIAAAGLPMTVGATSVAVRSAARIEPSRAARARRTT